MSKKDNFQKERDLLNDIVMKYAQTNTKRFFNLDNQVYNDNFLSKKTKELLGLVASMVLRCDDCIKYHLINCFKEGYTDGELEEALSVSLIVGGSIVIPHLRRAYQLWDEMKDELFENTFLKIKDLTKEKSDKDKILYDICKILRENISYYDWVGFYFTNFEKNSELILGPFVGEPTEHTKIAFGQGICGQAADRKETFIVQDVSKENNYLSCSIKVKSEIVVPIIKNNVVIGEIDIDSHKISPFSEKDKNFLEKIAELLISTIL